MEKLQQWKAILNGHEVVPLGSSTEDNLKWSKWFNEANRHVALTGIRKDGTQTDLPLIKVPDEERKDTLKPPYMWGGNPDEFLIIVSTVFVGGKDTFAALRNIDLWFETITRIMNVGDEWGEQVKSSTWEKAEETHKQVVAKMIKELQDGTIRIDQ